MTSNAQATITNFFANKDIARNYASAERATGPPAQAMILQAIIPSALATADPDARFEILDNACGTGVVSVAVLDAFRGNECRLKLVCGDFSPPMVEAAQARIATMEGVDADVRVLDGQAMDVPANTFTHVLTNFGFQSFPDPLPALRECIRVARPGGTIGMTNWVQPGWVPAFCLAVSRVPGAPASLPDPLPFMTRTGRFFEAPWTREQLQAIPDVDAATIQVEEHTFTMDLKNEEEVRGFVQPWEHMLSAFTAQWSEAEQKACEEGRLLEAMVQAILEEPTLVWKYLVTTFNKTT